MLPFTPDQFFAVFEAYNLAIWPAHVAVYAVGALVLWSLATRRIWSRRAVWSFLGALWLWNGLAYHGAFFAPINDAAYGFAVLFIVQGLMLLAQAVRSDSVPPEIRFDWRAVVGVLLIAYAAIVYSVLGAMLGHGWPRAPVFGVAPCPTTIFTLALLLLLRAPWKLGLVPLLWSVIGSTAAVLLGVQEDLGLLVAGLIYMIALLQWGRRHAPAPVNGIQPSASRDRQ